jgi:hypothetical protein
MYLGTGLVLRNFKIGDVKRLVKDTSETAITHHPDLDLASTESSIHATGIDGRIDVPILIFFEKRLQIFFETDVVYSETYFMLVVIRVSGMMKTSEISCRSAQVASCRHGLPVSRMRLLGSCGFGPSKNKCSLSAAGRAQRSGERLTLTTPRVGSGCVPRRMTRLTVSAMRPSKKNTRSGRSPKANYSSTPTPTEDVKTDVATDTEYMSDGSAGRIITLNDGSEMLMYAPLKITLRTLVLDVSYTPIEVIR